MAQQERPEVEVEAEIEGEGQVERAGTKEAAVEELGVVQEEVPEEAGEGQGELEELQERLAKAEAQAAEYLDGWQRAQAEFSNYRKRQEADRAQMMMLANANLLRKLLPIVDDFERAMALLPPGLSRLTWCEGVFLIKHKLEAILESEGVKPVQTEGQIFDPLYHEAVTHEEVAGYDEGQIVGEVQRGYMVGDRVLRPALVRVARAPSALPEEGPDTVEHEDKE